MINEISPNIINVQFSGNKSISENDYILYYNEEGLLWKVIENEFSIPQKTDFEAFPGNAEAVFLFTFNNIPCFLLRDKPKTKGENFVFKDITFFRAMPDKELAWLSLLGYQFKYWYQSNRYCGKCAAATLHKTDERAIVCPSCNTVKYPLIAPAIIVAVICNHKILLIRGMESRVGWHTLIAGYVDFGETLEQAVKREVAEEVGLEVKNIRYYKSQPWPLSGSMMIGFVAEADENEPIKIDEKEVSEAVWFHRGELPPFSPSLSIAGEMIEKFERGEL
ncbi:MAG: NAD(+) diphosphatase [Bacteroidales bacterium]|nr:NAD(+) diphosphatase [Bacteroidales bacterium]